jgi:peptidoglycan hydrolase-like protein with peptidoglycan-binding domain
MSLAMPANVKKDARASVVWRVQKYLKLLGYNAGDVTGKEDRKTTDAVKTFEIRTDFEPTGKIDESLAKELREIWISRNIPISVGFDGQ